jgi:DNA-binding LytR/AlgR family response regulator
MLKMMLEEIGCEVTAIFDSGDELLKKFRPDLADILIMDIHLSGSLNGVDTSVELMKISAAPVIFITNETDGHIRKRAIHETNAVYYLSKPFEELDICVAIDMALKSLKKEVMLSKQDHPSYLVNDSLFIRDGFGFKKVLIAEILYLKADGSYSLLVSKEFSKIYTENLSFLAEKFAFAKELIRVHRSYIVNINYIQKIKYNTLWINNEEIPIGKTYIDALKNIYRFV